MVSAQPVEFSGNAFGSTCLAVVVRPVLAFFAMWAVSLSGPLAQETLLLLAVPAGFFGVLLGIGYGVKPAVAGTTLLLSAVLSVVTLSVLIAVLPRI